MNDRDRLLAVATVSIAAGTIAIIFSTRSGLVAVTLVWVFAAIAVGAFAALPWPWYRRALSGLRTWALRAGASLHLPVRQQGARSQLPAAALASQWRFTTDGMMHPQLARIAQDGFSHPAYARPIESTPHYVRVKALVACSQLGDTASWQDLRGRFLGLITHAWMMTLISELTVIRDDATWQPRATSRRSWLEADLAGPDSQEVPVASAKLLLPETGPGLFGTDRRCAELILHVDLVQSQELVITVGAGQESKPVIQGLPYWRRQILRALTMPGDLEGFLRHDLGLMTSDDPPAQFGILLQANQAITDIVSPRSIRALPAASPHIAGEYIGFAVADPAGKTADGLASEIMLDLSQRVLHLDGSQDEMSGLAEGTVNENDLDLLRKLAIEGQVMRARVPPREKRGVFDPPPQDLRTRFESWQTEVAAALLSRPELLTQFESEPVGVPGILVNRASEAYWRKIEQCTDVLTSIVKALGGHA